MLYTSIGADPYCKVTCGSETVVTPVRANTLDPNFDSHVVFYVKNPEDATVKIQVSSTTTKLTCTVKY